ncbi:hypothetical protein GALMADRAFT_254205 [Galerina marginata CBS 339.88]|uniref:Uncharacterized protein n=1 Tax=Galerina marginata (strain CBS 339.88) TaxID=685588 RepID=A0A067SJC7_GALM3|nr:hypothetical protein GALMADRAFT_254205 [Galerina marginata CBS 339.88]
MTWAIRGSVQGVCGLYVLNPWYTGKDSKRRRNGRRCEARSESNRKVDGLQSATATQTRLFPRPPPRSALVWNEDPLFPYMPTLTSTTSPSRTLCEGRGLGGPKVTLHSNPTCPRAATYDLRAKETPYVYPAFTRARSKLERRRSQLATVPYYSYFRPQASRNLTNVNNNALEFSKPSFASTLAHAMEDSNSPAVGRAHLACLRLGCFGTASTLGSLLQLWIPTPALAHVYINLHVFVDVLWVSLPPGLLLLVLRR